MALSMNSIFSHGDAGVEDENTSSVSLACRKRRLNGAVSRNNRKKGGPVRCLDGHVKEPYEMSI